MSIDKSSKDKSNSPVIDISPKQRRIVKAKIKGLTHDKIAETEYPTANPEHRRKIVSNELKKPNVAQYYEQSKLMALKEHNITWSRIIKPLSDGLSATNRIYDKEGNIIVEEPDLNTQMRASKQASELLRVKEELDPATADGLSLPSNVDEIQLIRLMKK